MPDTTLRPLLDLYPHRGLTFVQGEGAELITRDGARYLDLMTNYGTAIFGHGHPEVTRALTAQLGTLANLHGSFENDLRLRASRALVDRVGLDGAAVCWSSSGAEAVEAALKFAVVATGRSGLVACRGAFHGKTLGALAVTHAARYREPFARLLAPAAHVPYGEAEAMDRAVSEGTAAVIVEPIQGEGGVVPPPAGWLGEVRAICDRRGALLILDEIQTGCGRTGAFLASHGEGVRGDMVCLGKGLAGGIPVGATVVGPVARAALARGVHTSTFGGNPLAAAGALAVLNLLDDARLSRIVEAGHRFRERLRAIDHPDLIEVRGRGLMIGVAVRGDRDRLLKGLQRERILAIPAGHDAVRFLPPYIVSDDQLDRAAACLGRILAAGDGTPVA